MSKINVFGSKNVLRVFVVFDFARRNASGILLETFLSARLVSGLGVV